MDFAERIKQRREEQKRSTYDVSAATGISAPLITMYERRSRKPKLANVVKLSAEYEDYDILVEFLSESLEKVGVSVDRKTLGSSLCRG
jgi:transcriptional regulator with XRE-family HTH domain|tara:strand:- start:1554 stop:1817 length:264 start_codon:yes stop_codon:yes gene_type:complete